MKRQETPPSPPPGGGGGVMVFCFVQNFFFGQHKYFFWSRKARNFFPEFHIRLYGKNSELDFFFFLHQNQNIFFSNIGNQNIFLEKNHTPPPFQVKWSFPKITYVLNIWFYPFKVYSIFTCNPILNINNPVLD
jgi:hypothetical protein